MSLTKLNNQSLSAVTSAGLPAGTVLQVVQATGTTSTVVTNGNTYNAVAAPVTITPTSTSNKIMISHSAGGMVQGDTGGIYFRLKRGSTVIWSAIRYGYSNVSDWSPCPWSIEYVDTPATTSAVTYTLEIACEKSSVSLRHNTGGSGLLSTAVTIAKEIAG